jgi:hypothetical protein
VAIQLPFLLTFRHVSHPPLFHSLSRYRRSWAGPELCRRLFRSPRQPESEHHGQHSTKHSECESAGFLSTNLRRLKSKDIFCTEQQCLSVQCSPSLIKIYSPLVSRASGSNPDQNFGASFWGGSDPNFLGALFQYHVRCIGLTKNHSLTHKFLACPGHCSEGRPWYTGQSFNTSHLPGRAPTQLSWSVLPSKYCNLLMLALSQPFDRGRYSSSHRLRIY